MVGDEELSRIKAVLDSGFMTEGPVTAEFEQKFARYVGVKHAIASTSCTTALEIVLRAWGVGPGDEIISPDFTYPITAGVAYLIGAKPVLVDVDPNDFTMDYDAVEKAITPHTKAVLPVSLFGSPIDISRLRELQRRHGFKILEDAACAAGASIQGKKSGSFADASAFSFHPRKVITTGEGGMITTDDDDLAKMCRYLKRFGITPTADGRGSFTYPGTNYKLSDVLAALGVVQMEKVDKIIDTRVERARVYDRLVEEAGLGATPVVKPGHRVTYQSYIVRLAKKGVRDQVIQKMRAEGIETQIGTFALHMHPAFANARRIGTLENSRNAYENTLALPLHHDLTQKDQERVVYTLKSVLASVN